MQTLTSATLTSTALTTGLASTAVAPSPPTLTTTHALLKMLDTTNLRINRSIRYVHDYALYGKDDYWTLPLDPGGPAAGDCKDYVLEKRRSLIAAGIPAGVMSIAIVRTPYGETHAVLLVATDRGELVLDSLSEWVKPWRKVGYTWIERQIPGRPLSWVNIDAAAA